MVSVTGAKSLTRIMCCNASCIAAVVAFVLISPAKIRSFVCTSSCNARSKDSRCACDNSYIHVLTFFLHKESCLTVSVGQLSLCSVYSFSVSSASRIIVMILARVSTFFLSAPSYQRMIPKLMSNPKTAPTKPLPKLL